MVLALVVSHRYSSDRVSTPVCDSSANRGFATMTARVLVGVKRVIDYAVKVFVSSFYYLLLSNFEENASIFNMK